MIHMDDRVILPGDKPYYWRAKLIPDRGYEYCEHLLDHNIWAYYPNKNKTPQELRKMYREPVNIEDDLFLRMGKHIYETDWNMHDLIGTEWRNLHTAGLAKITYIGWDRFGYCGLYGDKEIFDIGHTRKKSVFGLDPDIDIYIVSYWIKTDNIDIALQLKWHEERIRYIESNDLKSTWAKLELALENEWFKPFIEKHQKALGLNDFEVLNSGKKGQLSLL